MIDAKTAKELSDSSPKAILEKINNIIKQEALKGEYIAIIIPSEIIKDNDNWFENFEKLKKALHSLSQMGFRVESAGTIGGTLYEIRWG